MGSSQTRIQTRVPCIARQIPIHCTTNKVLNSPFLCILPNPSLGVSLVAQRVKNLPAMQEIWVWFLSYEDPLEKRMATHSSILAWRIPWTEEPGELQFMGLQRVGHDWVTYAHTPSPRACPVQTLCPSRQGIERWPLEDPIQLTHMILCHWGNQRKENVY